MHTLDRILVATSFSDRSADAVRKAAVLAAERHASLTLLHVVEPVKNRRVRGLVTQEMLLAARVNDAKRELAKLGGEIAARQGVPVELCVEVGDKFRAILAACKEADVLFVGGTAGRSVAPFSRPAAERLLEHCDIPILLVNGPQCLHYARALVVVRDAAGGVGALKAAGSLWPAAEKVVFYAVNARTQAPMQGPAASTSADSVQSSRSAHAVGYLRGLVRRAGLRVHDVSCRFRFGDACKAALAMQSEVHADVMVLTRRRSPSIAGFVLGKSASRLLATAPCDVLITAVTAAQPERPVQPRRRWRPERSAEPAA
jgi:nucleotide-binding universal stress UspA family protein